MIEELKASTLTDEELWDRFAQTDGDSGKAKLANFARSILTVAAPTTKAQIISDAMMDLADRLGHEWKSADPRAWSHLLVYAPTTTDSEDAARFRWLTEDHADAETRAQRRNILDSMDVRSYSAACRDIDLAMGMAAR
jgi:hypothetical protein